MTIREYIKTNETETSITNHHWGFRDAKGRELGCAVVRHTENIAPRPRDHKGWFYRIDHDIARNGVIHSVVVQATRDGAMFGHKERRKFFATKGDADNYEKRRIENIFEYYVEKFG